MAKSQPKIDDIKDLKRATNASDGLMSKEDKVKLDSAYKPKGNIADKTALLALTDVKQGDVYNAQASFTLINGQNVQNVKAGDNIVCLSDAATSDEANWDNLSGNIDYEDLGDMPMATDTEVGGIKIGFTPDAGSPGNLPVQLGINDGINDNLNKAFVVMTSRNIKQTLGINNSNVYNGDDIFVSGLETPSGNFNEIFLIGSYRVYGSYSNAPNSVCGTNTGTTDSMVGSLNVFRSGANDWELIQQLFWVQSGVVEQYQRSFNGTNNGGIWTVWKRLIKCDDFATLGRGGIVSEANFGELFRAPDLIQLWNENELSLAGGVYYLNNLSIETPIKNTIEINSVTGKDITELTSERRYRATYEVHCIRGKEEGEGEVTIKIENGDGEIYSISDYISNSEIRKSITFSVIITGTEVITPSIEVGSELTITIPIHYYQVSIEEIKFPYFTPIQ